MKKVISNIQQSIYNSKSQAVPWQSWGEESEETHVDAEGPAQAFMLVYLENHAFPLDENTSLMIFVKDS